MLVALLIISYLVDLLDLPVIGNKITDKHPNVMRFYFENFNGIRSGPYGTDKGKYFGKLMEVLEVDVLERQKQIFNGECLNRRPRNYYHYKLRTARHMPAISMN